MCILYCNVPHCAVLYVYVYVHAVLYVYVHLLIVVCGWTCIYSQGVVNNACAMVAPATSYHTALNCQFVSASVHKMKIVLLILYYTHMLSCCSQLTHYT